LSLYVGIDLGTSGCRATAIDDAGKVAASARAGLPAPEHRGTSVEQAPELWWDAVLEVLGKLCRQVPAHAVRAIAVDGTSATLLLTDGEGRPLAPALMYNDSRAREEATRIARLAPRQSGAHGATSGLAKLLHLQGRHREARHALHQADWIAARLGGSLSTCDENNALKLGFDPAGRRWPAWLEALGFDHSLLPTPVPPGTPTGTVSRTLTERLGLGTETRIVAGTTDSVAAFLATGAEHFGEAVTSLGSTLVLKVLCERPVFAPEHGLYSHRLGERWLAGGASNSGGAVLLRFFSREALVAMTPRLRPGEPTGLDYYPLPARGERFPVNDPEQAPRLTPRPRDDTTFFQGMLEGIARIERQGYRLLQSLGAPYPVSVRTVGGGAANPAWTLLRGRMLEVPMLAPAQHEAAYGAARLARRGAFA